jgi:hypothetical protein
MAIGFKIARKDSSAPCQHKPHHIITNLTTSAQTSPRHPSACHWDQYRHRTAIDPRDEHGDDGEVTGHDGEVTGDDGKETHRRVT